MPNYRNMPVPELAQAFKALSNPNRLQIYLQLLSCCPPGTSCAIDDAQKFCVSELGQGLDVASSTLSHHIKELNQAGLIQVQRRGKHIDCWVDPERVEILRSFFEPTASSNCA
jgi:ArsR family transcriptional regulator